MEFSQFLFVYLPLNNCLLIFYAKFCILFLCQSSFKNKLLNEMNILFICKMWLYLWYKFLYLQSLDVNMLLLDERHFLVIFFFFSFHLFTFKERLFHVYSYLYGVFIYWFSWRLFDLNEIFFFFFLECF